MDNYRQIVEKHIRRKLLKTEIIHHKDGDSHNNQINNLEIVDNKTHLKRKHLTSQDWENIIKNKINNNDILTIEAQDLNNSLNIFFTPRQKEIIFRKVYSEKLSKTEKEYYSRTIRKKLVGLLNNKLRKIAELLIYK